MFILPNFHSISVSSEPIAPTYEYNKVFEGTLFVKNACVGVRIVKDSGVMQVHNYGTPCASLLPARWNVSL